MSIFFNGRQFVSPATMSAVDDSKMYSKGLSVGNTLALVGMSSGGAPKTAMRFGSTAQARAELIDGPLLDAIERAFSASSQSAGPSTVVAVRVSPATQSSLILRDAAAQNSIVLTSTNFGLMTNQIRVKVEAGTSAGLRLTSMIGTDLYTADNIVSNAFGVQASAPATAVITVTQTTVTVTLAGVATAIDLSVHNTVQALVDRLSTIAGVSAIVLDGNGEKPTFGALDAVSSVDIKAAQRVVTANRMAAVEWFNSIGEGLINATSAPGATLAPEPVPFTYLAGGGQSVATNTDWADAFTALESVDVQWVVPLTGAPSIHAMASSHVSYMSDIARMERRAVCGTPSGTSDAAAIAAAKAINSDRVSLTHLGVFDYNRAGALVLFEPFIAAAMVAAAFAGLNPGTAMTNKSLRLVGMERKLRNPTDTDQLLLGGILCLEDTPTGYKVVQSITTWLTNKNYNRREISVGVALDFTMRSVRNALDELRGAKNNPIMMSLAVERTESVLRELARPEPGGPGVLAGDEQSPPYKNITAYAEGDVLRIEFQASPVLPVNYIPVVCFAVPYSGQATST
jgi:hypothetical protein